MRWHDDAPIGNRGSYHPNRERRTFYDNYILGKIVVWVFGIGAVIGITAGVVGAWLIF